MAMRRGYLHAIEGILAALIVVLYINSIIAVPAPTDWTETTLSKRSEDLLSALDRSGFLDDIVMRDDVESFGTFVRQLDSAIQYEISVNGLPQQQPHVAVLVNNTSTYEASTTAGSWSGAGLPSSEDGRYREGNLSSHPAFGDVGFVLSDTEDNEFFEYTSVNLDLNDDGDFGDAGEGPYQRGDIFRCTRGVTGCDGHEYVPGPFNTTIVLYNATFAARLQCSIANTSIGERTVKPIIESANPTRQSLQPFNVLIAPWNESELDDHRAALNASVADGSLLVVIADVADSTIESGYLNDLGFSYIEAFNILGSGQDTDIFYSLHDPRNQSYYPANLYGMAAVTVAEFTSSRQGTLTLRSRDIGVRRWLSDDAVAFETEDYAVNYTVGDTVTLLGNTYAIQDIAPLALQPDGQQRFDSYETGRVRGDFSVMRMANPRFNTSQYDTRNEYTSKYQNKSDLPKNYTDGVAGTNCDFADYPYRLGNVSIQGTNVTFLLVNFQTTTPCDDYHEFVYFDMTDDGDFDDSGDTGAGYSADGTYQDGDTATFPVNQSYIVDPYSNGNGTALERVGPRFVGELPVNREVFSEGSTALIGRERLGHDDLAIINALILSETRESAPFTPQRTLGDTSVGYTYTSMAGGEVKLPYTLNTVWWFQ